MPAWAGGRKPPRKPRPWWTSALTALLLLAVAALVAARLDPLPPPVTGTARASDGDTLRLGGDRIRLLGIDAPELEQSCTDAGGHDWPCGRKAHEYLQRLLAGRISCSPDGHDKYGRILARCSVAGRDLGADLVAAGMAVSYPDYGAEEAAARADHRGVWQGSFTQPRLWRQRQAAGDTQADDSPSIPDRIWGWFRELTGARNLP